MSYSSKTEFNDNPTEQNYYNNDDDLEKTLVLAAANADSDIVSEKTKYYETEEDASSTSSSKRAREEEENEETKKEDIVKVPCTSDQGFGEHSNIVARHYNSLEEKGPGERSKSRIFHMRSFNNWIKSMLISTYLRMIKSNKRYGMPVKVLDMCCGKGGDLLKWRKGNINHLVCADIASVSVEQCETRYQDMKRRERLNSPIFTAEFISADLTNTRLREKFRDPSMDLDLVSCQFSFHYSFESIAQADCMLRNASECLRPGGYFIGTIPDAYEIMARQRKHNSNSYGNDIYNITFNCDTKKPPLFGAKYDFQLEDVVNCPEFLVHFPTFEKLARQHGLELVSKERFDDFYEKMKDEGKPLLLKMQSLETYPSFSLVGTAPDDYEHMKSVETKDLKFGTLSKSEWEASTLYLTFAFQKLKKTWTADGKPQYS